MPRQSAPDSRVTLFLGQHSVSLPRPVLIGACALVAAAVAVTVVDAVAPVLAGILPGLALPDPLRTGLVVLAYAAGTALLASGCMSLLDRQGARRSERRFIAHDALLPLDSAEASTITIAPNPPDRDGAPIAQSLRALIQTGAVSSAHVPVSRNGERDLTVDRVFITTTLDERTLRQTLQPLACDDIARVPARYQGLLARQAQARGGSFWLLVWD